MSNANEPEEPSGQGRVVFQLVNGTYYEIPGARLDEFQMPDAEVERFLGQLYAPRINPAPTPGWIVPTPTAFARPVPTAFARPVPTAFARPTPTISGAAGLAPTSVIRSWIRY